MWRDARGSHAHTKPNFTTTSSSSAQRSADCYLQSPEDRSSWRRHGILHADPAEVREEDPDPLWPLVSSSKMTKPNRTPATTTHMAAAAVLCCEEQKLPQSAGSHTIGIPPPESGLRDLRLIPKNYLKARRKRTATKVYDRRSNISFSYSCKITSCDSIFPFSFSLE